ncbi:hypothetical protein [Mycolicibacterium sediminis]|uniref:Uncharacterized protein n=1 Tax=Mycolicibacterium sediminis TaxID=1286180 RepID=A0A7I7QP15_9MYCO|nr:hypothetical protein [Mycolicibacterium sediminis]BBY27780.1 hypothetical protein MSEDJ_18760 [Mycolicibacterium sediminis]
MPPFDGAVITDATAIRRTSAHEASPVHPEPPRTGSGRWTRVAAIVALSVVACWTGYEHVVTAALAGSRTAHLLVVPLLAALIATGYRSAPRGVRDSETDVIIATLFGIVGLTGLHLVGTRIPTLAGLWQLHQLAIVVWLACAVAVLFSVRHAVRMWALWLFVLCCATPLPFLLAAAGLGGSRTAHGLLTAAMGAVAVFLAGRYATIGRRSVAALGCLVVAAILVVVVGAHLHPLALVLVVGGLVPAIATLALSRLSAPHRSPGAGQLPALRSRRSLISLGVLAATAGALLIGTPARSSAVVATVDGDWIAGAGLGAPTSFPFITRLLGPGATLERYAVPGRAGLPAAAVDVMTTSDPAALDDVADAVWYPTALPLEYRPASGGSLPPGARTIHTNADTATDGGGRDWYAVTWTWRAGPLSQRVTVITSQTIGGDVMPPAPRPLTLLDTAVRPAMWLMRQQPDAASRVDPLVRQRADEVVGRLVGAHGV